MNPTTHAPGAHPAVEGTASDIPAIVARMRKTFADGRTRGLPWRLEQLRALERMLAEQEAVFAEALAADLGRPPTEAWLADLAPVRAESVHARKHLRRWMREKSVGLPLPVLPGRAWYQYEPLGTVLVIGPWNYPVFLTLAPLVAAIAAGNCAVVKPSEHTPAVAAVLADLLPRYWTATRSRSCRVARPRPRSCSTRPSTTPSSRAARKSARP